MLPHLLHHIIRPDDLGEIAKITNPCEKLWTYNNIGNHGEMRAATRDEDTISSQPIQNRTDQLVIKTHAYVFFFTAEHTEYLFFVKTYYDYIASSQICKQNTSLRVRKNGQVKRSRSSFSLDTETVGLAGEYDYRERCRYAAKVFDF